MILFLFFAFHLIFLFGDPLSNLIGNFLPILSYDDVQVREGLEDDANKETNRQTNDTNF